MLISEFPPSSINLLLDLTELNVNNCEYFLSNIGGSIWFKLNFESISKFWHFDIDQEVCVVKFDWLSFVPVWKMFCRIAMLFVKIYTNFTQNTVYFTRWSLIDLKKLNLFRNMQSILWNSLFWASYMMQRISQNLFIYISLIKTLL